MPLTLGVPRVNGDGLLTDVPVIPETCMSWVALIVAVTVLAGPLTPTAPKSTCPPCSGMALETPKPYTTPLVVSVPLLRLPT